MTSDETRRSDPPAWRQIGVGHPARFRCAICNEPRETTGRKLRRVGGLKTWVCKQCAKE